MNDAASAAPGWYPDTTGHLRWWDGSAWGPYAPPGSRGFGTSHAAASISHLGFILGGFLTPLIVYLVTDRTDAFTRGHAREALNFQLTFLIPFVGSVFLLFGFGVGMTFAADSEGWVVGLGFIAFWLVYAGSCAANLVFGIVGAVRASRGETFRYPVRIPFVRG